MILTDVAERWEDPCFLWDDNGEAYLGCSQWGGLGMNGISKPVQTWTKSDINKTSDRVLLQTDDDFSTEKPGYQWKFNHNPDCNLYDRTGLPAAPFRTDCW